LNFGNVANLWIVSSGEVDATVHAFLRTVSGSATFAASRVVASGKPLLPNPQAPRAVLSPPDPTSRSRS
jgi:hypothetical protein